MQAKRPFDEDKATSIASRSENTDPKYNFKNLQ